MTFNLKGGTYNLVCLFDIYRDNFPDIFYLKQYSYDAFIPLQVSSPSTLSRKTQEVYVNRKLKVLKN